MKELKMHTISWFEIATSDLDRAEAFYSKVFQIDLKREKMGEMGEMAIFPHGENDVSGSLTCGPMYKPSSEGTIVYLYVEEALDGVLNRIAEAGGETVMPPLDLGDIGHIALFKDIDQNIVGLHTK
jgi:predicted enzyme related to lactoylglutathione lyase